MTRPAIRGWLGAPLRDVRAAALAAALLGCLVYANTLANGFAYDDVLIIQENESIQEVAGLPAAIAAPYWPNDQGAGLGIWRPLITGLFGFEWAAWGDNPLPYHLLNLLLHGAVSALVVLLLAELLPLVASLVGGLVFAVHPVHVEAVANIVGRAEVLSALFYLSACLVLVRGRARLGTNRTLVICLLYALAFLTKESAVTLPGVVLLLDGARDHLNVRDLRSYLARRGSLYAGLVVTAAAIVALRYGVLGTVASPYAPLGADLLNEIPRIWTVASIWPHYFRLMFFPAELSTDYSPAVIPVVHAWNVVNVVGASVVLVTLFAALVAWRRGTMTPDRPSPRTAGFGVVWFVITISPIANVVFLSGVLLAERTLYLPSVGFAAGIGWLVVEYARKRPRLAWAGLVVVIGLMGVRTVDRNPVWVDNDSVFDTLMREYPESGRAQWAMGDILLQQGNVRPALYAYRMAIGILGGHYTLLTEIGRRLIGRELYAPAELLLSNAWEDHPSLPTAPTLLAIVYSRLERFEEAEEAARAAIAIKDDNLITHHILARSLAVQGRYSDAIPSRMDAIQFADADRWRHFVFLAELQAAVGDTAAAVASVESARRETDEPDELGQIERFLEALHGVR